ncbi:unnamed protein product [Effrenium voratum]|nr:unnamed protein product [Effrenium voratum]
MPTPSGSSDRLGEQQVDELKRQLRQQLRRDLEDLRQELRQSYGASLEVLSSRVASLEARMKTHPMVVKASTDDDFASTSESPVLNVNRETTWDSEGHSVNVGAAQSVPHEDGRLTHADIMLNEANEGIQNQNCMANLTQGVTEEESKDLTASQALRKGSYGSVAISESVWSFPLVFGLARAGRFDSVYSVLLLLLNLGMQAMFSGILMSEGFMGSDFSHEVSHAKLWRTSVAHDIKYMDLAATSLATRVCKDDGALILAPKQATLISNINSFMGLKVDQFTPGPFQPGTLLCILCILLWSLCVYKEFRALSLSAEALLQLPRSRGTVLQSNMLMSLSRGRLAILLGVSMIRAVIAGVLLGAGILWLARTTSITELMLNAVALNAILDVDEFLFAGFTPISMQLAVRKLQPVRIRYSARRSHVESVTLMVLLATTMLVPYFVLLKPQSDTMLQVKWELCGGNRTFVVSRNAETQLISGLVTEDSRTVDELSVSEIAVDTHKFQSPYEPAVYISFATSQAQLNRDRIASLEQETQSFTFCVETDYLHENGTLHHDTNLEPIVLSRLRAAAAALGRFDVSGCEDVADLCLLPSARLLRMICGDTCGCTDPLSSGWHKVPAHGCTDSCLQLARDEMATLPCQDQPIGPSWLNFWDTYIPALSDFFVGQNISKTSFGPEMHMIKDVMKANGCSALQDPAYQLDVASSTSWCEGDPSLFRPLSWVCPESCGCLGENPPLSCPTRCARWNESSPNLTLD